MQKVKTHQKMKIQKLMNAKKVQKKVIQVMIVMKKQNQRQNQMMEDRQTQIQIFIMKQVMMNHKIHSNKETTKYLESLIKKRLVVS